jgi:hypothetical protein
MYPEIPRDLQRRIMHRLYDKPGVPEVFISRNGEYVKELACGLERHEAYFDDNCLDEGDEKAVGESRGNEVGFEPAKTTDLLAVDAECKTDEQNVRNEGHQREVEIGVCDGSVLLAFLGLVDDVVGGGLLALLELGEREYQE